MKVTLKYEESESEDLHMTLRLTLPQKYVSGDAIEVVKLFVNHYNKKHTESLLAAEDLHLKIVGGNHLKNNDVVGDELSTGDECYLLGKDSTQPIKRPGASAGYSASVPPPPAPVAPAASSKAATRNADGKIRCKNFGCQQFFDPDGSPQDCLHHKAAPIFHETAKWWSCCDNTKAYDWEEFMRIPGCTKGFCAGAKEGQKRFLGGADLRGDNAPVRLDADAPRDPRHKLDDMRKGLVAIGVDGALFEHAWSRMAAETADLEKVCDVFSARFTSLLSTADV